MRHGKKVLIFGAGGRVGSGLARALLRHQVDIAVADILDEKLLAAKMARATIDLRLADSPVKSQVNVHGDFDVLDEGQVTELLISEKPDLVVNYAIPFTWDATKQLSNYSRVSAAGLGAFAPAQVLVPKIIAQAIAASEVNAKFVVGNLPDITIPIIHGLGKHQRLALPMAGAGNVGLIAASLGFAIASEHQLESEDLAVSLVAHHVHWVAPREPGYRNDAPFLLKVVYQGNDITQELGDPRELMNRSIVDCYEAGAGFSSTTASLAAQVVMSLLAMDGESRSLHVPGPNGLPGGYPVTIKDGKIDINLPSEWKLPETIELMKQAHKKDGIDEIEEDGTIHFDSESVDILKKEVGITLPEVLRPSDLEIVAKEQIMLAQKATKMI